MFAPKGGLDVPNPDPTLERSSHLLYDVGNFLGCVPGVEVLQLPLLSSGPFGFGRSCLITGQALSRLSAAREQDAYSYADFAYEAWCNFTAAFRSVPLSCLGELEKTRTLLFI